MKRTIKRTRLSIGTETIRNLSAVELSKAVGGRTHTLGIDYTCTPTDATDCQSHFLTDCC